MCTRRDSDGPLECARTGVTERSAIFRATRSDRLGNRFAKVPARSDQFFFFVVLFLALLDFEDGAFADDLLPVDLAVVLFLPDFALA